MMTHIHFVGSKIFVVWQRHPRLWGRLRATGNKQDILKRRHASIEASHIREQQIAKDRASACHLIEKSWRLLSSLVHLCVRSIADGRRHRQESERIVIRHAKSEERRRECDHLQKWRDTIDRNHETVNLSSEAHGRCLKLMVGVCRVTFLYIRQLIALSRRKGGMAVDNGVWCCLAEERHGYPDDGADEQGDSQPSAAERSRANDSHWRDDLSSECKDERGEVQANLRRILKWRDICPLEREGPSRRRKTAPKSGDSERLSNGIGDIVSAGA